MMRKMRTPAIVLATALVAAIQVLTLRAAEAQVAASNHEPCTSVVSPMIATMRFGADVGLATVPSLTPGVVGSAAALTGSPQVEQEVQAALNATVYPHLFDGAMVARGRAAGSLEALDELLSVLALGNEFADTGITFFAASLDQVAATHGRRIAPADRTLADVASASRYYSSATCGP